MIDCYLLSEHQLEQAARMYCDLVGIPADELTQFDPGGGHAVLVKRPAWKNVAEEIRITELQMLCINTAKGN